MDELFERTRNFTGTLFRNIVSLRSFQNLFDDIAKLKSGDPLIEQAVVGGDA